LFLPMIMECDRNKLRGRLPQSFERADGVICWTAQQAVLR
jgi:hypothetical protein